MILTEPSRPRLPGRLLALVTAVALVGVSVAIRQLVIEDGDDDDEPEEVAANGDLAIVCVTELAAVCNTLDAEVTVEDVSATSARLSSGDDVPYDAWLTFAPLAEGDILARSPLVIAARSDRASVFASECGEFTWSCLGSVSDEPWAGIGGEETWGDVKPAHPEPVSSALGRLVLGQGVGSFLGFDTFSKIDWESNDAFPGWFQQLERGVPSDAFQPGVDPFARWIQTRPVGVRYDFVATTEAEAVSELATAAPDIRDAVTLIYPAPVATADVVLAPIERGRDAESLHDAVREALAAAGYRVDDASPEGAPAEAPALPDGDGLPSGSVLQALTTYWENVVR